MHRQAVRRPEHRRWQSVQDSNLSPRPGVRLLGTCVQNLQYFFGDVVAGVAVHHFLKNQIVPLHFSNLLDSLIGFVQNLLEFLISPCIQVFLKLAPFALELAILVRHLFLTVDALTLGQRRAIAVEFLAHGL